MNITVIVETTASVLLKIVTVKLVKYIAVFGFDSGHNSSEESKYIYILGDN